MSENGTELLRLMGLINVFGDFIPDLTNKMKPLCHVLIGSQFNVMKQKRRKYHISTGIIGGVILKFLHGVI